MNLIVPEENLYVPIRVESAALINREIDFWLLGGISILAWFFVKAAQYCYGVNPSFDRQVVNLPYVFSALTLICNHPHFISSYRIGYGQGFTYVRNHWFGLIAVPLALISLCAGSFFMIAKSVGDIGWLDQLLKSLPQISIVENLSSSSDLGSDMLRFGVWMMWILVGWHYAKQAFGVMIAYARIDNYLMAPWQRALLKYCLLLVVPTSFIALNVQSTGRPNFQDLFMTSIQMPEWLLPLCQIFCAMGVSAFLGCLAFNYLKFKAVPSINFLLPFVTFYLWWYPGLWPLSFMLMVPFFHSLQYLPFAVSRIGKSLNSGKTFARNLTFNIIGILVVGFIAFDLGPSWLDQKFQSQFNFGSSFFLIAMAIFLNVHHFFIDAVIWRAKKINPTSSVARF